VFLQFSSCLCILETGRRTTSDNDTFNFSGKKEPSAFLKFVEDGIVKEKFLQRVRSCNVTVRSVSERLNDV